ncbi:MAG: glycosyltransferase family 4 protein [Acidimicrobiales bacterium]
MQSNPAWGSCEEYLLALAAGVRRVRPSWSVDLVVPTSSVAMWRGRSRDGVTLTPFAPTLMGLARCLRQGSPDLIHVNDAGVLALAAARLRRVPVVTTYHTPSHRIAYNWRGRRLEALAFSNPRLHAIVLSESNRHVLASKQTRLTPHLHVIPHGLPAADSTTRDAARNELSLADHELVLLSVSRLAPQKRLDVLLRAMPRALDLSGLDIRLLIAGDGELASELEALTTQLGIGSRVQFLGWRSDVARLLAAADLFVLTSDYEGLPYALLEAMRAGTPVVCTAVDGVKDVVTPGLGWLVPAGDPELFAEAIVQAAMNPDERAGRARRSQAEFERHYTEDRMIDSTIRLYEQLTADA